MRAVDPNDDIGELISASPELAAVLRNLELTEGTANARSLADRCRIHGLEPETTARVLTALARMPQARPAIAIELMSLPELCRHALGTSHPFLRAQLSHLDDLLAEIDVPRGATAVCLRELRNAYAAFRSKLSAHLQEESDMLGAAIRRSPDSDHGHEAEGSRVSGATLRLDHDHQKLDEDLDALISQTAGCSSSGSMADSVGEFHRALCEFEQRLQDQIFLENRTLFPRTRAVAQPV